MLKVQHVAFYLCPSPDQQTDGLEATAKKAVPGDKPDIMTDFRFKGANCPGDTEHK